VSAKQRPRILAVDDATDLLALMAKALGADYEVSTASDAGTAIEMAFARRRSKACSWARSTT